MISKNKKLAKKKSKSKRSNPIEFDYHSDREIENMTPKRCLLNVSKVSSAASEMQSEDIVETIKYINKFTKNWLYFHG